MLAAIKSIIYLLTLPVAVIPDNYISVCDRNIDHLPISTQIDIAIGCCYVGKDRLKSDGVLERLYEQR